MKKLLHSLKELRSVARSILAIQFAFNVGSFLVVPFIAVYLNQTLGFSLAFVGLQLTIKLFAQRGLMLFGGIISDRIGPPNTIGIGVIIRAASFLLYMIGRDDVVISLASFTFGIGGALFIPSSKAALSAVVEASRKQLVFSLRSTASNLGMAVGGVLGSELIYFSQSAVFATAAILQLSCGLLVFHPAIKQLHADFTAIKVTASHRPAIPTVASILRTPSIALISLLYGAYIALYSQFEFTLPLAAAAAYGKRTVGVLFFVNTMMVFLCQIPLNHFLAERFSHAKILALGFLCIAMATLGFAAPVPLGGFLALAAWFSIGEIVIDPSVDALSCALVDRQDLGTLFGLFGVVALIGGSIGNFIGSHFFVAPKGGGLWGICTIIAVVSIALSLYQGKPKTAPMSIPE